MTAAYPAPPKPGSSAPLQGAKGNPMAKVTRIDTIQVVISISLDRSERYRAFVRIAPAKSTLETVGVGKGVKGAYATEAAAIRAAMPVLEDLLDRHGASERPLHLTILDPKGKRHDDKQ
jgi:hypothetical protein